MKKMLAFSILFIFSIQTTVFADIEENSLPNSTSVDQIERCYGRQDPTDAVISGENFNSQSQQSYHFYSYENPDIISKINAPYSDIKISYRAVSVSQPRIVESEKVTYRNAISESCKGKMVYALVDYTVNLENGYTCQDTLVFPYDMKSIPSAACFLKSLPLLPIVIIGAPLVGIESALRKIERNQCFTSECALERELNRLGLSQKEQP